MKDEDRENREIVIEGLEEEVSRLGLRAIDPTQPYYIGNGKPNKRTK